MASLTKVKINNIDTSIEYFADPLLLLNFGSTLANTDIGFIFNRDGGISSNVALYWDETRDRISVAYTTTTGLPNGNIALSSYANIAAAWYFGNIAGGTTGNVFISANVLPTGNAVYNFGSPTARWNVGYFAATTLDLGGSQISVDPTNGFKFTVGGTGTPIYLASNGAISGTTLSSATTLTVGTSAAIGTTLGVGTNITAGGYINAAGNILSTGGVFNALTVNGNESVTGYVNVTGNVLAAVFNGGQVAVSGLINTAGNVLATAGTFNALTVNGNESVTGYLNVTGNILGAVGTLSGLTVNGNETVTGFLNVTGNILATTVDTGGIETTGVVYANSTLLSTSTTSGALQVAGGTGIAGNLNIGTVGAVSGQFHTIRGNITQSTSGGAVYFNTAGNVMAAVGQFGSINSTGYINTSGNISTAQLNAGQINTTGNVLATAGTFNALTVNGNESVTGYLNVTGNVMAAVVTASQFNTPGNILSAGAVHNALTVNGNETITGYLNVTGNVMAAVVTASQFNTAGNILSAGAVHNALTVNGNESVTGYLNVSGNVLATRVDTTVLGATGVIWANSTTDTTSTTTGAIVIPTGGLSVGGNAYVGHNLYVGTLSPAIGATLPGLVITAIEADPLYVQIAEQNLDNRGSTDYAAYASDSLGGVAGWVDMGFTGNAFSDATYTITKPHDGYLFVRPNATFGGNLVLATSETGVYNDVIIGLVAS